jgi:hypothetical protein
MRTARAWGRRRVAAGIALLAIVAAGAVLRGERAAHPWPATSTDERAYLVLARSLAHSVRYGGPDTKLKAPFHWAPGAPALFALARKVDPPRDPQRLDPDAVYVAQAVVGTLTIVACFGLGALAAGAPAGLAGAAAVAFYPPLIAATGHALSEPLGALTLTLALLALAGALRRPSIWRFAAAGAALGAAALARADLLPAAAVLVALAPLALRRRGWRTIASRTLACAGGLAVAAGAYVLPASLSAGGFVPISTAGTSALYVGTYLPGDGTVFGLKHALGPQLRRRDRRLRHDPDFRLREARILDMVAARHPQLDRDGALRLETRRNLSRYALRRPGAFLAMLARKAWRMWGRPTTGTHRRVGHATVAAHRILLALAAAGLIAGIAWARLAALVAIAAVAVVATAVSALSLSEARHALPVIPALLAGGAAGWSAIVTRVRAPSAPTR